MPVAQVLAGVRALLPADARALVVTFPRFASVAQVQAKWLLGASLGARLAPSRGALAVAQSFLGSNASLLPARCPKIYLGSTLV